MAAVSVAIILCLLACACLAQGQTFTIRVVDEATGRGVPLVDLATVNQVHYWTDSNGVVAFDEPGLMGQTVFFTLISHGYEFPADGFGYHGTVLRITPGGRATLKLRRLNIAERLYRITGAAIYRDSVLVGEPVPLREPLLNAQVFGQDSVLLAAFRGELYWFWGDTSRPGYPLGNFHTPGATSMLPAEGGLPPDRGVDLRYFVDDRGFAKETAHMAGDGPTWLGGLTVLRDEAGAERMFASFAKVRQDMSTHRRGIAEWDPDRQVFEERVDLGGEEPPIFLNGHTFQHTVGGTAYVYSGNPYPLARVKAQVSAFLDPAQYEAFTCLKPGATDPADLDRAEDGSLRWGWKRATRALGCKEQAELVKAGKLAPEEGLLQLRDADTGAPINAASGSVYFNAHRRRWVMVTCELFGTSVLGEVWYAEADGPLGSWVYARKVVTHDRYSFYNPLHHPVLDEAGGRIIYFEGTYTATFSGNEHPTPRYDYNQIMYRLDLDDPRLMLPVAVYEIGAPGERQRFVSLAGLPAEADARVAFFAPDRAAPGTVPVWQDEDGTLRVQGEAEPLGRDDTPAFYALPADAQTPPATTVELLEFAGPQGRRAYAVQSQPPPAGSAGPGRVVCRVWRQPMRVPLPRE